MSAIAQPRALAVRWKDLHVWSPRSFASAGWACSPASLKPLRSALRRRQVVIDRDGSGLGDLQLITIRFSGAIEPREVRGTGQFKGQLYAARSGDVVYSKIDVRNGAIGVIPAELPEVVISSEYPVYEVVPEVADAEYVTLLFRTARFRAIINSMVSGASGRKRIEPDALEKVEVPLPSLPVQRAIVARWRTARDEVAAARARADVLEGDVEVEFLSTLGLRFANRPERPQAFAALWKDLPRWGVEAVADDVLGLDRQLPGHHPYATLNDVGMISYGIQKTPLNRPDNFARPYLRVANVRKGFLALSEIKHINVSDAEMAFYRLEPDDLLFVEGNGSRAELGRVAIWRGEIADCVHQNHLIRVRLDLDRILPEYVMTWFNTNLGRSHFFRSAKSSSGLGTINSSEVRSAPIPLPPLDVQRALVERVREARTEIARERDAADRRERESREEIEALIRGSE